MTSILREFRFALRRLLKAPTFSLAVVATVGIGVGGATAAFGVVHAVLLRPLPYPEPERLYQINSVSAGDRLPLSMADYFGTLDQQTHFLQVAAYDPGAMTLSGSTGAERVSSYAVTPHFLSILGVEASIGRAFAEDESLPAGGDVAMLSWGFWQSRFGGDPGVVGTPITLDERPFEVIGVLPRQADPLTVGRDVLVNLRLTPPSRRGPFFLRVVARLHDEADPESAATELREIGRRIHALWRDSYPDATRALGLTPLREAVLGDVGRALWSVLGAVAILLLLASTNATILLVARAVEQGRALAVRAALGASRLRLLGYRLAEALTLAGASAVVGMGIALYALGAAATFGTNFLPRASEIRLSGPVVMFLMIVTAGAFLLFGSISTVQTTVRGRRGPGPGTGSGRESRGARRLQSALVSLQFAWSTPLIVGGTVLLASLHRLSAVDPGFDVEHVAMVAAVLPSDGYDTQPAVQSFWDQVLKDVEALPGVEAAGLSSGRPPDEPGFGENFVLEDRPLGEGESQPIVPMSITEPGYFDAMGVPLVAGAMFDQVQPARRLLSDASWARRYYGSPEAAVGKRILHGGCTVVGECPWWTVVGVVGDVEYNGLATDNEGALYLDAGVIPVRGAYLTVRVARGDPANVIPAVRGILRDSEPRAPIVETATGQELLRDSLQRPRYLAILVSGFATVAVLLVLVGIYGVLVYLVERGRREIGIRLALGGSPQGAVLFVLGRGMRLAVLGTVVGLGLAWFLAERAGGLLFQVEARDPLILSAVGGALLLSAFLACLGPAGRAGRIDPAVWLREE